MIGEYADPGRMQVCCFEGQPQSVDAERASLVAVTDIGPSPGHRLEPIGRQAGQHRARQRVLPAAQIAVVHRSTPARALRAGQAAAEGLMGVLEVVAGGGQSGRGRAGSRDVAGQQLAVSQEVAIGPGLQEIVVGREDLHRLGVAIVRLERDGELAGDCEVGAVARPCAERPDRDVVEADIDAGVPELIERPGVIGIGLHALSGLHQDLRPGHLAEPTEQRGQVGHRQRLVGSEPAHGVGHVARLEEGSDLRRRVGGRCGGGFLLASEQAHGCSFSQE
ncbi:hypothetical protein AADG42_00540 [Ammonicoccus fulvus]|uniref:Uncharacterized protein n=1 Tax=Ammonicoccus fulvus TaxID=3138240 RepID=A0ABZ3FLZ5_9ACTN